MAYDEIRHKDLYKGLNNLRKTDWRRAAQQLGLEFLDSYGKGPHSVIWDPKYSIDDIQGLVSTVVKDTYKSANQGIFKNLLARGIAEDDIWRALKLLR